MCMWVSPLEVMEQSAGFQAPRSSFNPFPADPKEPAWRRRSGILPRGLLRWSTAGRPG